MIANAMSRELVVQRLIEDQAERIRRGWCGLWLLHILESGFRGFDNMSDEELAHELQRRGLRAEFDDRDVPVDEEDDAEFEDDDELSLLPRPLPENRL
jgi:hypothetical protein